MKGEDKMFLLEAYLALNTGDTKSRYRFMMHKEKNNRVVDISQAYTKEEFNEEVLKIKEFCDEQI
jgi:hypothetical protein